MNPDCAEYKTSDETIINREVTAPLNLRDLVFGLITTFGIYAIFLAIEPLGIENFFIGKQDSAVCVFLEPRVIGTMWFVNSCFLLGL